MGLFDNPAEVQAKPELKFERLNNETTAFARAKIFGGWLVRFYAGKEGVPFVPDPNHEWDGGSLN